jgi:hypothetical protein
MFEAFRNTSIARKLLLGFGIVTLLTMFAGYQGLQGMATMADLLRDLHDHHATGLAHIRGANTHLVHEARRARSEPRSWTSAGKRKISLSSRRQGRLRKPTPASQTLGGSGGSSMITSRSSPKIHSMKIGIGAPGFPGDPCHTTGQAGPHPAVRKVEVTRRVGEAPAHRRACSATRC